MGRLLGYAAAERRLIVLALISMLVHAACRAWPIFVLKELLDDVLLNPGEGARGTLLAIGGSLMVVAALGSLTYFFNEYAFKWLATHVMVKLRADLMQHLLKLPLSFFHRKRMAYLVSRLTNDVQITYRTVNIFISEVVLHPISIAVGLGTAFFISWQLSLLVLPLLPLLAWPVLRLGKVVKNRARKGLESLEDTTQVMLQTIDGIRTVKSFRAEDAEFKRFVETNEDYLNRNVEVVKAKALGRGVMDFIYHAAIALFVVVGGLLLLSGTWDLSAGKLVSFIGAMGLIYRPVKRLAAAYGNFQEALAGSRRLFELLDTPTEVAPVDGGMPIEGSIESIRFEGVSFAYERHSDRQGPPDNGQAIIKDVSFELIRGTTTALVGRSGSGKSTLADLLGGFYRPDAGRISVDGQDLKQLDRHAWLDRVGFVSQSPFVFNASIRDNIRYGRPDASDQDIEIAARAANLMDLIESAPKGLDTIVGERGVNLSGGELQRLTIARAILKDSDILILDEATSALDSVSEKLVQEALDRLSEGRTSLVIAHRLSTVRDADQIVVLEAGHVKEVGTHDELLARGGSYAELHAIQLG